MINTYSHSTSKESINYRNNEGEMIRVSAKTITFYHGIFKIVRLFSAIIASVACCFLILTVAICWIRNRPDGVYKTNENILVYCSPNPSQDLLVSVNSVNREYFC